MGEYSPPPLILGVEDVGLIPDMSFDDLSALAERRLSLYDVLRRSAHSSTNHPSTHSHGAADEGEGPQTHDSEAHHAAPSPPPHARPQFAGDREAGGWVSGMHAAVFDSEVEECVSFVTLAHAMTHVGMGYESEMLVKAEMRLFYARLSHWVASHTSAEREFKRQRRDPSPVTTHSPTQWWSIHYPSLPIRTQLLTSLTPPLTPSHISHLFEFWNITSCEDDMGMPEDSDVHVAGSITVAVIPCTQILPCTSPRSLAMHHGNALVPIHSSYEGFAVDVDSLNSVMITFVTHQFALSLRSHIRLHARVSQSLSHSDDPRFRELYTRLIKQSARLVVEEEGTRPHSSVPEWGEAKAESVMQLDDLIANGHVPLCIQHQYTQLKAHHWLHYHSRSQFSLFMKSCGLPLSESVKFWKAQFGRAKAGAVTSFKPKHNWNKYSYGVRYMYGKQGRCVDVKPFTCKTMCRSARQWSDTDPQGCPLVKWDDTQLLTELIRSGLTPEQASALISFRESTTTDHGVSVAHARFCQVHAQLRRDPDLPASAVGDLITTAVQETSPEIHQFPVQFAWR